MKKKLLFQEVASRITGFSISFLGASWNPPASERKIVKDVLVFLEDRRALYSEYAFEIEAQVNASVLEIRQQLTNAIQQLPDGSNAIPHLRAMRSACREYLNSTQREFPKHVAFLTNLGRLRALFGVNVAYLAVQYEIDIEGELASILPPEPKSEEEGSE